MEQVKGGSGQMHGKTTVGTQQSGVSSQEGTGGGEWASGGGGKGFYSGDTTNKDHAGTQMSGTSAATKSGGDQKFISGGPATMCPNTGSRTARAGRTGHDY